VLPSLTRFFITFPRQAKKKPHKGVQEYPNPLKNAVLLIITPFFDIIPRQIRFLQKKIKKKKLTPHSQKMLQNTLNPRLPIHNTLFSVVSMKITPTMGKMGKMGKMG